MHIGIFGGAFDPPHVGHSQVAKAVIDQATVDEVWFVPVYIHPWAKRYGKQMTRYEHRCAMVQLTLGKQQHVQEFREVSYTFDTLEYFSKLHPEHTFSWIMGSEYLDRFSDFLTVHPGLQNYQFYVYPRAEHPMEPLQPFMKPIMGVAEVTVSSTEVRERLKAGQSITELVHPAVAEYCTEHTLYV